MIRLKYDDTPPSLNTYSHAHWRTFYRHKQRWESIFADLLRLERDPQAIHIHAVAGLRFPQQRRRDEGNFRTLLEKALGDALVNSGWLADDTPDFFTFGEIAFSPQRGTKLTIVDLLVDDEAARASRSMTMSSGPQAD